MMPNEFLFPGCQRLFNIGIPVLPPLQSLVPVAKHKRETFEAWLKSSLTILAEKVESLLRVEFYLSFLGPESVLACYTHYSYFTTFPYLL